MSLANNDQAEFIEADVLAQMSPEDLLQLDVGQIKDVEAYVPLPSGLYGFQVKEVEMTEVGAENKPAIKVTFDVNEVIELEDDSQAEEVGELPTKYTEMYLLQSKNSMGLRMFATTFRPVSVEAGASNLAETMDAIIGAVGQGFIKRRSYRPNGSDDKVVTNNLDATTVTWG